MRIKRTQTAGVALLGLACACVAVLSLTAQAQRTPNATNQIAFADYDTIVPGWDYGYWYAGPTPVDPAGSYTRDRYFSDPIIDPAKGQTVFQYTFDSTVYAGTEAVTSPGGWWGTGFGMPVPWKAVDGVPTTDSALFSSSDPADYILSFDARVEGLLAEQTTADCDMEFRIGTGGGSGWVMIKALRYHPGTNWAHFEFNLDQGNWIGADQTPSTSLEMFTNAVAAGSIIEIAFNHNLPNPTQFGFDYDNAVYLDNVKLEVYEYAGPPPPPPPKVAVAILDYNFDDKDTWWAWPSYPDKSDRSHVVL